MPSFKYSTSGGESGCVVYLCLGGVGGGGVEGRFCLGLEVELGGGVVDKNS